MDDGELDGGGAAGGGEGKEGDKVTSTFTAVPAYGQYIKKNVECMILREYPILYSDDVFLMLHCQTQRGINGPVSL